MLRSAYPLARLLAVRPSVFARSPIPLGRAGPSSSSSRPVALAGSARFYAGADHGFNDPTGYIFGEKPPPPGQKRTKEAWEYIVIWPTFAAIVAYMTINYYKANQLEEWAEIEAKRRLKERGEYPVYERSMPAGVNFNPPWKGMLGVLPTDEELAK